MTAGAFSFESAAMGLSRTLKATEAHPRFLSVLALPAAILLLKSGAEQHTFSLTHLLFHISLTASALAQYSSSFPIWAIRKPCLNLGY